jgi:hypothetical protein
MLTASVTGSQYRQPCGAGIQIPRRYSWPMRTYRFALLYPAPRDTAESRHNDAVLGALTLGVEVTMPALAIRCGLGNIDPQHSGGANPPAAIEACLDYQELPPPGAYLVTIRPDLDALGGMAVLSLRSRADDRLQFGNAIQERVAAIARQDSFDFGPWPGPTRLPSTPLEYLELLEGGSALAPLAACVADHQRGLAQRVALVERWLVSGEVPTAYRQEVEERAGALRNIIASGSVRIDTSAEGRVAVIEAAVEGALRLGYCLSPVGIALNPAFRFRGGPPHRKFTICQYAKGHIDLAAAAAELGVREPGWGGSAMIIGSPQGRESCLALAAVVAIVERHLT